jgi:hypothetical protein
MLVIHGIWWHGALSVWAEDSGHHAAGPARHSETASSPRPHPFAAAAGAVADVLAEVPELSDLVRKAVEGELTLWLPSTSAGPVGSPDLASVADVNQTAPASRKAARSGSDQPALGTPAVPVRRGGRAAAATALAAWQLPVLRFDASPALGLLRAIAQPDARTGDGVLSGSLRYLAALAVLAADLAARGRVLPGLNGGEGEGYAARWRPVLTGADALRARELTVAPPAQTASPRPRS